jgi:acyl-CoA reductase-like NAD-dependent aldehyde dehydrogenase
MTEFKIYKGGEFTRGELKLDVNNPYNGKPFAFTWLAGQLHLEEAINAARKVQEVMKNMPSFRKYEILQQIAGGLMKAKKEFAELLCLETAKPIRYAVAEVERAVQTFTIAAEESKRLPKEYISLDWTPAGEKKEGLVKYFPVGLVAGISPFNFPLNLAAHKIAPAITAGCPIILKPASATPLSTLKLATLADSTDLPKGAFSVLPMDRQTGNQLVTDERIQLLSFTGSPEVGWKMKNEAGRKKVILELGGNAGVIVTPAANMEIAVKKCLMGGFSYSGQVCIHAQRIYVHQDIYKNFIDGFVPGAIRLKAGDPVDPETEVSSMIDEENAIRVEQWVKEAVAGGARILCGGERKGAFFQPTVLTGTNPAMKVCAKEIFGPVVVIEPYSRYEDALASVNNSRYGLQAGVFTNRIDEMNLAFDQLEVGGVLINEVPAYRVDHMPYGGVKESGLGREGLKYAILEMMEPRLMIKDT